MLLFKGVQILNNGRTLRLPIKYKYYGIKFKCKVSSQGVTIKSEEFLQPVVVPKVRKLNILADSSTIPHNMISRVSV